jgi:CubicO group peptidase (beta-lactamase class C family)
MLMFRRRHGMLVLALSPFIFANAVPRCDAQPVAARAGNDLLGLWGGEPELGPQVRGALLLERHGTTWTARVAGFEAVGEQRGDSVVITLAGGQGAVRLWTGATTPEAYWVQPAGMNQPFAVPVRLRPSGGDAWRGDVVPIRAQFPLYLMVTRADEGALRGTFRNPAANWPGRVPFYGMQRDGDNITFINPRTGKAQWVQPYDSARRTIAFDFDAPIILSPRTSEQAVGFVTRSPSLAPYMYRRPARLGDGWQVASAATAAIDVAALQAIVRTLVAVDPVSETAPRIHSLLVARHGRLVLDEYFRGYDADMPHDMRSASKTMTSVLAGAAMLHGASISTSMPIGTTGITLGHLLSHSSGQACNDDDDASPGNEDVMQAQHAQNDWYAFFMALPRITPPGRSYAYCSAGVNMAGSVIGSATGRWLPRVFETLLARPLQFGAYGVNLMPTGEAYAAGGMHILPRDFLKFGQLYLDGGIWHGVRLVPAAWVRTSTAHVIDRDDGSDDGYGWHRHVLTVRGRRYQTYEASGNGGQFLVVIPTLQLTIAVTAGNYGQYDVWRKIREELVPLVMATAR